MIRTLQYGPKNCRCDCQCESGWSGANCECATTNTSCMAPNGLLCSNHGHCECGACVCSENSNYGGPTCSDCIKVRTKYLLDVIDGNLFLLFLHKLTIYSFDPVFFHPRIVRPVKNLKTAFNAPFTKLVPWTRPVSKIALTLKWPQHLFTA